VPFTLQFPRFKEGVREKISHTRKEKKGETSTGIVTVEKRERGRARRSRGREKKGEKRFFWPKPSRLIPSHKKGTHAYQGGGGNKGGEKNPDHIFEL